MKLDEAIDRAETFINGKVKDTGYSGFREVMATLLDEVKRCCVTDEPCRCHACQIAEETNEVKGPLPSLILADMIDQQADALSELAGELNLDLKYEAASIVIKAHSDYLVKLAGRVRSEK